MIKKLKKFLIGLLPVACLLFVPYTMYAEEFDLCDNLDGVQSTMPAGMSSVGTPGQCYTLQAPVTIDIVPPGGEPQTIDIVPPSSGGGSPAVPQTIDVNPGNGPMTSATSATSTTLSDGSIVSVSTTTPSRITSLEELNAYVFDPKTSKEEKILAIETHIVNLLKQVIVILTAELEAAIEAKKQETASSTPASL